MFGVRTISSGGQRMAKRKTTTRVKASATGRRAGGGRTRTRAGKGEGLEIGNARRDAGAATPLPRAVAANPRRRAAAQLPDEKGVPGTERTVPVKPGRKNRHDDELLPAPAIDRRRQIVGTDDRGGDK